MRQPGGVGFTGLGDFAGLDNRGCTAGGNGAVALASVESATALAITISSSGAIWSNSSGSLGASSTSAMVNSAAGISKDFLSIPILILGQILRLAPPFLRTFHSPAPSPSTWMPLPSISRCGGCPEPRGRDVHLQALLRSRQGTGARNGPFQSDQPQLALDVSGGLPKRHAEQQRNRKTGLESGIVIAGLAAVLAVGVASQVMLGSNYVASEHCD